jgi:MFS family permease
MSPERSLRIKPSLILALFGYGLVRIASAASGVLVGLYIANLADRGAVIGAAVVGTLGAVSYAAELIGAFPLGVAADHISRRALIVGGALLGAAATQLFGMSGHAAIFFLSRALEGTSAAAIAPALLAHLAHETAGQRSQRARVMSYFELSLLGGLGIGGLIAAQLWDRVGSGAFSVVAVVYVLASACLWAVAEEQKRPVVDRVLQLNAALCDPNIRHIAPMMICVSAIVGLWLGPTLPFLLTHVSATRQYIPGLYAHNAGGIGWLLLGYSLVFATGLLGWSRVLPHTSAHRAMHVALLGMLGACVGIGLLNHSAGYSAGTRWVIGTITATLIMIESGFTPAALVWLTGVLGRDTGRGAAMGAYSVMLGIGAISGSLLAAGLAPRFAVDGLLAATVALAVVALWFLRRLTPIAAEPSRSAHAGAAV